MIIRKETPADVAEIRKLVGRVFPTLQESELVDRLRFAGDGIISLVAVDDGLVIGHALLSKVTTSFRALGLGPVSVASDRQRTGVGSRLITASLAIAHEEGWEAVFVLGNPKFYERFGFDRAAASGFLSPYAGPHFMVLAFSGRLPVTTGKVEYPSAFAALG